jgi:hypothetical protein
MRFSRHTSTRHKPAPVCFRPGPADVESLLVPLAVDVPRSPRASGFPFALRPTGGQLRVELRTVQVRPIVRLSEKACFTAWRQPTLSVPPGALSFGARLVSFQFLAPGFRFGFLPPPLRLALLPASPSCFRLQPLSHGLRQIRSMGQYCQPLASKESGPELDSLNAHRCQIVVGVLIRTLGQVADQGLRASRSGPYASRLPTGAAARGSSQTEGPGVKKSR